MGRAKKQARRSTPSAQRQPTALAAGKGNGVQRSTGTERPDSATGNPRDIADPQARVIKTRS